MEDKKKDYMPPAEDFLMEEPPLQEEFGGTMPALTLDTPIDDHQSEQEGVREFSLLDLNTEIPASVPGNDDTVAAKSDAVTAPAEVKEYAAEAEAVKAESPADPDDTILFTPVEDAGADLVRVESPAPKAQPNDTDDSDFDAAFYAAPAPEPPVRADRPRPVRKGRPKRKKGYGLFGIPHLLATLVWLAIIVAIGTSLGRMIWVCAADVLAFGRESKEVVITITTNDTIDDIAEKLHEAGLVRYPGLFKLYADIAVDEGDILPGTFTMNTLYDYHALVVQMGPRSSNRAVVTDVLIPEGYNCRQIFELLEQLNICTVAELEEYAANGEFTDFWFLEGVERGDKYCLEGYLFPDTYDFYANSTPREALGKMLLGFEARFTEEIYAQLPALNERLSTMMRNKGCSEEFIADNQLDLRDLLTVASLIEEETASVKESPTIASVIFNRLTEDQMYERYLNIDAAIIYATGDANNIDTSIDHPYNTYLNAGLTPGPISNPGLDSINAALNFEDTQYYYYVLNPETGTHQFSRTLEEHEKWVEEFRNHDGGSEE